MSAVISLFSSNEAIIISNRQVRDSLVFLVNEEFVRYNDTIVPISVFLSEGVLPSTPIIDELGKASETGSGRQFKAYFNRSFGMICQSFFEKIFGVGCCRCFFLESSPKTDAV
ncbi:hypothetical protein [Candidatus Chlamydia corallus]|uniref:hypothetical protein n=1 Tax=Candidatus Chlamydia corallus TaxID=2038470 RepID=UPI000C2FC482|nr:hypothetical protein [Candidatus Chlamydia corallus]